MKAIPPDLGAEMIRAEGSRAPGLQRNPIIPRLDVPGAGASPERILVVEDDRAVQKALRRLFETEGFSVEISADGKSAVESFRSTAPAAIVLDLRLPTMSGRDVCREIKDRCRRFPLSC